MTSAYFTYEKAKVIQALRYHFITRKEIKIFMVVINLFALISAVLFFFKKISPFAFLTGSVLWLVMMLLFWFIMPFAVYKKTRTFRDTFRIILSDDEFTLQNERGSRSWSWNELSTWLESPHFYHLYFNPRSFLIIPKDAFKDEDVNEVRKILRKRIKTN